MATSTSIPTMINSPSSWANQVSADIEGQIAVESKDEMRKRGVPSPDRAGALAFAMRMLIFLSSTYRRPLLAGFDLVGLFPH